MLRSQGCYVFPCSSWHRLATLVCFCKILLECKTNKKNHAPNTINTAILKIIKTSKYFHRRFTAKCPNFPPITPIQRKCHIIYIHIPKDQNHAPASSRCQMSMSSMLRQTFNNIQHNKKPQHPRKFRKFPKILKIPQFIP